MIDERKNNRKVIPFEENRIPDTDLPEGDELILIRGQEGLRIWGDDGEVTYETEPVTQVIAYGPKSRVILPGEIRTANAELAEGEERLVSEGYSGLQLVDENGEIVEEYPSVPSRIEYGPIREEVPFQTIRKPNSELKEGEERVLVAGEAGLELVDEAGERTLAEEPQTEEIEYGPKRIPVPFRVERVSNSDLAEGEFQIVTSGVNGLELEDEEGNRTPVSEPVSEVVEYGLARVRVPFETDRRPNPDLAEGKEEVITSGTEGLQLEDEEGNITLVSEPITEVIEYGPIRNFIPYETRRISNPDLEESEEKRVKPGVKGVQLEDAEGKINPVTDPITEVIEYGPIRHTIPFETKRVSTPDLKEGDERVVTEGVEGLELEDEEGNITLVSEPITEVIEYGPTRIPLAYETVRRVNTDLKQGEEQVVTEGEEGLKLKDETGKITTVKDTVTEEIDYGPAYQVLVHETIRTPHSDLAEGEEITLAKGINGLKLVDETGAVVEQYDPYTEVIAYGPDDKERNELKERNQ